MEPLRALLADAVISFNPRLGEGGPHRFGCGKLDTNCDVLVCLLHLSTQQLTFSRSSMMLSVNKGRL
jgi:hypothetical protein